MVAQDIVGLEELELRLEEYRFEMPQEKVYLHFDKPYYYSGDDIWWQALLISLHPLAWWFILNSSINRATF